MTTRWISLVPSKMVYELGVSVPLLDGMILDVAPAAHRLDGALGGPDREPRWRPAWHIEPSPRSNGTPEAAIHDARQVSRRAASSAGGQVGERERDALVVDDRRAERLAPVGVLGGVFECGPGDSERLRGDHRPGLLEGAHGGRAGMLGALDRLAGLGQLVLELVLSAEQVLGGHADAVELELGGVRRAAAELVELADELKARECRRAR